MDRSDDLRTRLLDAAEDQLVASPDGDIATRAVCEAVGVTQPVLYRLFGDKRGLLDALAARGLTRYAERKARLETTGDPVADLRAGWDDHAAFAREHPALYRLVFAPRPWADPAPRQGVLDLLLATLRRCAAAGALATAPETAAALILSANVGLALNAMAQPGAFGDPALSAAMRETVLGQVLVAGRPPVTTPTLADAAHRLDAQLTLTPPAALAPEEQALLRVWLARLAADDAAGDDAGDHAGAPDAG